MIVIALVVGVVTGLILQNWTGAGWHGRLVTGLKAVSGAILNLLRLLATPLIFTAIATSLLKAAISGRSGAQLLWLLGTNTLAAICIGLMVANLLQPGSRAALPPPPAEPSAELAAKPRFDFVDDFLARMIPKNFISPFADNDIVPMIVLAIALALALRRLRARPAPWPGRVASVLAAFELVFEVVLEMLHWVFALVPVAVFAIVTATVAGHGIMPLVSMGHFVVAVLLALFLQACFYLTRVRLRSWVRPRAFLSGSAEALALAFSTASSTATLPVTYRCATEKIGARPASASLGVMVGGSINNDGTALYEAMAALFVAQAIGRDLPLPDQLVIVIMAVVASVGAAGIPEAGLVTMIAVFSAVKLPIEYIPLLLPLDWFLDRCRTAMNVMGDLTVTAIIDGRTPARAGEAAAR